jgi:outer membrane protein assembly factor BamB
MLTGMVPLIVSIRFQGKIYIVDEEGTVYIIKDGDTFQLLYEVPMNDICMTAPAITDGMIFFRTQHYLYAVGKK